LVGVVPSRSIDSFKPVWVGWKIQEYTQKTTEIMPDSKSIIMAGYHVWDDMLELAIRKDQGWLYPGYLPLRTLEQAIANFLDVRGYKTAFPRLLSYKRLAQLAGFGNYGKNSLIISREFGPWIRLAAVLTNAEMAPDTPFEDDLCRDCDKCLKAWLLTKLTTANVWSASTSWTRRALDNMSYGLSMSPLSQRTLISCAWSARRLAHMERAPPISIGLAHPLTGKEMKEKHSMRK